MSAAATFSAQRKGLVHLNQGFIVVTLSVLIGGVLGFYYPILARIIAILYATLGFLLSKTKFQSSIFVTGALMFLIFEALPFDLAQMINYIYYAILLFVIYFLVHLIFNRYFHKNIESQQDILNKDKYILSTICLIGMIIATGFSWYLHNNSNLEHLYWIGLTVLVVLQSASQGTIKIALLRIVINTIGAIIIVILMSIVMPKLFWVNFIFLTLLLFAIFAFGYSYIVNPIVLC